MATKHRLGLRVKPSDEAILVKLANHLDRNLSDTVRFAIKYTARHHGLLCDKRKPRLRKAEDGIIEGIANLNYGRLARWLTVPQSYSQWGCMLIIAKLTP